MDTNKQRFKRKALKLIKNKNNLENKNINEIKINSNEGKNIQNNSNEDKKGVIYLSPKNKIKMHYNTLAYQERKKPYIYTFKNNFRKYNTLIYMIVSFMNLYVIISEYNKENIIFKSSEVILKVNETGNIKLFSNEFLKQYKNFEIYINDTLTNITKNEYYVDDTYLNYSQKLQYFNFVKIIWNDTITTTKNMFENCDKIIEIDLSNFDASNVNEMNRMFYGCSSLESLNLTNCNTSLVNNMSYMFGECQKLKELNLLAFDTSEVNNMDYMFRGCLSLTSLDVSSFNISHLDKLNHIFSQCTSLSSLDLSNFDT